MILIISVFVHFMYVIADDNDFIMFKLHPWSDHRCRSRKTKYIFHVNNEVDILVNSQEKLYHGWCKFNNDERFVTQTVEYILNEHKGIFRGYKVSEAIDGKFKCCLFYNRGVGRNISNVETVLYNDVQYSQKCCNTHVAFVDDVIINFVVTDDPTNQCLKIDDKTEYNLKETQRLVVKTISTVGAGNLSCVTEVNKTIVIHNSDTDYKTITEENDNQLVKQSAQKEFNYAETVGGQWKCSFKIDEKECQEKKINIIKELSKSETNMTTVYIAVGVSLAVLLIIAQTWGIFYFRNKAKAAARLERLSTGKTDDQKKDERVYSTTPSLSALKAKQDDRVESEIYETIDTINIDPGLRPPVPLPTETDDDFYEDPETVKAVFTQGGFLPSTSSVTRNLKPKPPPCSTLPSRKKEKSEKKEVSQDRPPLAVPKVAPGPLKPPVKPVPKPASAHIMANELNTVFKRLNKASSPATPTMKLPVKPTLPRHPKPSPSVVKETAPLPVFPSQKKLKPVIQTAKPVGNHKVPVNYPAKRPLPPPAQHSNIVSPPRPPKPVAIKPESDPEDLSDDSEFDEYDVLPQYNIYNR